MNRSKISIFKLGAVLTLSLVMLVFGGQAFGEDDDEDGGTIIFTKPVKSVVFEHKNHIDQGLECDSCHDGDMAFASNTRCTVCHIGVKGYNRAMGKTTTSSGH